MPGDTSITHRALILAALARGGSVLTGANVAAGAAATARVLSEIGARCTVDRDNSEVDVEGCGWEGLREPDDVLDVGDSATTLRALLGVCAGASGLFILTGDESLRRRPMLRAVAPLRQMGAAIDGRRHADLAPLAVRGRALEGIDLELASASADVKTALLLAGLRARGTTTVREPAPSSDHTERMLQAAGMAVARSGTAVSVQGGSELRPVDRRIPGDVSSATFFVVAATLVEGSHLRIDGVGLNPTRSGALEVLKAMGADLEPRATGEEAGEPVGEISVRAAELAGVMVDPGRVPSLIDEVPVLAVAATQAQGETVITGAGGVRLRESDPIAVMAAGLRSLGGDVEELPDGLVVRGPTELSGGEVDCAGDHRIALAFAVAGLVASDNVRVRGWSATETSFPEFLDLLGRAQGRVGKRP